MESNSSEGLLEEDEMRFFPAKMDGLEYPDQCQMLIESPQRARAPSLSCSRRNRFVNFFQPPKYRGRTRLALSFIFLFFSLSVASVMWLTDIYDNSILKLVSIRNDIDLIFNLWRRPPTRPILSIYIFNYTNYNATLEGSEKPFVEELGPYVFREKMERINIKFHDNKTVSFQENKSIEFFPDLTHGSLNDTIRVPNIPVLATLMKCQSLFYPSQTIIYSIMKNLQVEPFQNVTVNDFIWGYEDKFLQMVRNFASFMQNDVPPKFGFLAKRNGVHHHTVTMTTSLSEVGDIVQWDGASKLGCWGDSACDQVSGSDGTLFPGKKAAKGKSLRIFSGDMCRSLPLIFNKTTKSKDGFPVQQYHIDENLFDFTNATPNNLCYKYDGGYPTNGVFNTGPCQKGAPSYASFPHFWKGDAVLRERVLGLNPDPEKHRSTILIHEKLGVTLLAKTRFQLNIKLHKAHHIPIFSGIEDGTILPIAWMEYDSGPLPEHFVNVVYHLTYTVRIVQQLLQWITLICLLGSSYILYQQLVRYYR